ncbi:hypothetical protein KI387_011402, partial [Taxus chinensis]
MESYGKFAVESDDKMEANLGHMKTEPDNSAAEKHTMDSIDEEEHLKKMMLVIKRA